MRTHYILLIIALIAATACNQKLATKSDDKSAVDSLSTAVDSSSTSVDSLSTAVDSSSSGADVLLTKQEPLTYLDSVYIHEDLVNVAEQMCRMDSIISKSPNIDFSEKKIVQFNPKLVAYFDRHHKSKNMSKDQKIESVLNEIKVTYQSLVSADASTPSRMNGLNVYNAVDLYREFFLFNRMEQLAQNEELRAALRDEMQQWRSLELDLSSYAKDVTSMFFWGGSLRPVACLSAYQDVLESRIEDQNNLNDLLLEKKGLKSRETLKHAEKVFLHSLKSALNDAFDEENSKVSGEYYNETYKESQKLQKDIKGSLSKWLKARERLGIVANVPPKECQMATAAFLIKLSKKIKTYGS